MQVLWSVLLSLVALTGTTVFHYEVVRALHGPLRRKSAAKRRTLLLVFMALVAAHLVEIAFYAALFAVCVDHLGLGQFTSNTPMQALDYLYYAAETYSSLGYGDIFPLGTLRLLAAVEPLNGLLLLGWSGSFLFVAVQRSLAARSAR